ncbi:MAG TPA: hypothetical protein V6D12_22600 [Candidatus Obscuribacterales bacterium]
MVNQFLAVTGASVSVRKQLQTWNAKIIDYLREYFNSDFQQVRGTLFGDAIAKIAYLTETAIAQPDSFRGVVDLQGRLQAAAIVEVETDCLRVDIFTNAPWNVILNQPETMKGAATSLVESLVNESKSKGFSGRIKLYSLVRATQFYTKIGFVETDVPGEMELTNVAAEIFLNRQLRFRKTGNETS